MIAFDLESTVLLEAVPIGSRERRTRPTTDPCHEPSPKPMELAKLTAIVPATNGPPTLGSCVAAIRAADNPPEEILVIDKPPWASPAAARNDGARMATGDVLVFVDSDVSVHVDAFSRIRAWFEADPRVTAVFGSYDDSPPAPGFVSTFRNLLHHYVHHQGTGPATTFWAGLGAIGRAEFLELGGFDERQFRTASVEDIELGMRLAAAGRRIELDPSIQGTHLKQWTLGDMLYTDLFRRGVPWVTLLLARRSPSTTLNLGWRHRLSAAGSLTAVGAIVARRGKIAAAALLMLVALNAPFYRLLIRRQGMSRAAIGVGLHVLHHLTGVAAVPLGVLHHLRRIARTRASS